MSSPEYRNSQPLPPGELLFLKHEMGAFAVDSKRAAALDAAIAVIEDTLRQQKENADKGYNIKKFTVGDKTYNSIPQFILSLRKALGGLDSEEYKYIVSRYLSDDPNHDNDEPYHDTRMAAAGDHTLEED